MPDENDLDRLSDNPDEREHQLKNSYPFFDDRALKGPEGNSLLTEIMGRIAEVEVRHRALRNEDARKRQYTISVFLGNLAIGALNKMTQKRFCACPLRTNYFSGKAISYAATNLCFETLTNLRLIVSARGYWNNESDKMRSRMRATEEMRQLIRRHRVKLNNIHQPNLELIRLRERASNCPADEPADVRASREIILRVNELIGSANIDLPQRYWIELGRRIRDDEEMPDDERLQRQYVGDLSAKRLYRVFTREWKNGGRLYGGWWIGVPKAFRKKIKINGQPTAELDYSSLHPILLFARNNQEPPHDFYKLDGYTRELCKLTFMRLLNRNEWQGGQNIKTPGMEKDVDMSVFIPRFLDHLKPVREFLGTGVGLELQREDSELALKVLSTLASENVIALPIHDSFIVQERHKERLRNVMLETFQQTYGRDILVK